MSKNHLHGSGVGRCFCDNKGLPILVSFDDALHSLGYATLCMCTTTPSILILILLCTVYEYSCSGCVALFCRDGVPYYKSLKSK